MRMIIFVIILIAVGLILLGTVMYLIDLSKKKKRFTHKTDDDLILLRDSLQFRENLTDEELQVYELIVEEIRKRKL